jgi:zinc transport system substrate-binding protein
MVYVVNYPLAYFAERIGGGLVEVVFPLDEDEDPAFWVPSDEVVAGYQGADLIVDNGAGYAKWMATATLPAGKIVDSSAAFAGELIEVDEVVHSHGEDGEHAHGGTAFTTWLDFGQAVQQAEAVYEALAELVGEGGAEALAENWAGLRADLEGLDEAMRARAREIGDLPLVASHPVYQYWARRYGLAVESVHWEPEEVPGEGELEELEALLAEHPAAWMIWEGEAEGAAVAKLAERGLGSVVFDPCAARPEEGDFLDVMRANVEALAALVE